MRLWIRSSTSATSSSLLRAFSPRRRQRQRHLTTTPKERFRLGWVLPCCLLTTVSHSHYSTAAAHAMSTTTKASCRRAVPYEPPAWASHDVLTRPPRHGRLRLGNLPTPLHALFPTTDHADSAFPGSHHRHYDFYVKRDDGSGGLELGGNKVRKLEFLLADALYDHDGDDDDAVSSHYDSVVTIGGQQSNHCRATAAACRMVGLEPHLILRSKSADDDDDDDPLGLVGNLLVDRLLRSRVYTCTPGEYGRVGSVTLLRRLARHLRTHEDRTPYCIPVGGSNGLGTWGYIEAVREVLEQWKTLHDDDDGDDDEDNRIHHICFACGSGGTAAGIALGTALAFAERPERRPTVHAVGVCDDPDYFYRFIAGIVDDMGFVVPRQYESTEAFLRDDRHLVVHQGKGLGYAASTPEELDFIQRFAVATGIMLDPVYSGKALYNFMNYLETQEPPTTKQNVLFWHTGGGLGLYDKVPALQAPLQDKAPCQRLDVYGNGTGLDVSEPKEDS